MINGLSFSAAAEFCAVAKNNSRGKFIGEETGGTYCGNTSGNFVDTTLPHSQISISLPTTKYTMAVKETKYWNRGIIPDYVVTPTIFDIIRSVDVQLNYAIKLTETK